MLEHCSTLPVLIKITRPLKRAVKFLKKMSLREFQMTFIMFETWFECIQVPPPSSLMLTTLFLILVYFHLFHPILSYCHFLLSIYSFLASWQRACRSSVCWIKGSQTRLYICCYSNHLWCLCCLILSGKIAGLLPLKSTRSALQSPQTALSLSSFFAI